MYNNYLSSVLSGIRSSINNDRLRMDTLSQKIVMEETYDNRVIEFHDMLANIIFNLDNPNFKFGCELNKISKLCECVKKEYGLPIPTSCIINMEGWAYVSGIEFDVNRVRIQDGYSISSISFIGNQQEYTTYVCNNIFSTIHKENSNSDLRSYLDLNNISKLETFDRNVIKLLRKMQFGWC